MWQIQSETINISVQDLHRLQSWLWQTKHACSVTVLHREEDPADQQQNQSNLGVIFGENFSNLLTF